MKKALTLWDAPTGELVLETFFSESTTEGVKPIIEVNISIIF